MKGNRYQPDCPEDTGWKGDDDLSGNAWRAVHSWNSGMDDQSVMKMLAEAENDPIPKFEVVADPANPRRTVDAVRAATELDRALREPSIRSMEIGVRKGRVVGISVEREEEIPAGQSIDALVQSSDFQTVSVTRHRGRTTGVTVRQHRPLR